MSIREIDWEKVWHRLRQVFEALGAAVGPAATAWQCQRWSNSTFPLVASISFRSSAGSDNETLDLVVMFSKKADAAIQISADVGAPLGPTLSSIDDLRIDQEQTEVDQALQHIESFVHQQRPLLAAALARPSEPHV